MRLVSLLLGLVALATPPARGAELSNLLTDYTVAAWTQRDGVPTGTVWALAQDRDGYLWLGSDQGLYGFDGSRFTPAQAMNIPPLPKVPVRALLAQADGTLWIGFEEPGGVIRLRSGQSRTLAVTDSGPLGDVRALLEERDGTMWAGTSRGLFRLSGDRWIAWPRNHGLPAGTIYTIFMARSGDLLVGGDDGVYRKRRDAADFEPVEVFGHVDGGVRGLAEDAQGRLIATDLKSGFRMLGSHARDRWTEQGRGVQLLADKAGNMWVATGGQGLWRVTLPREGGASVQKATALTGLLAEGAFSLLEDRDGNIWAGTSDGLNRFTPNSVKTITDLGIVASVQATSQGSVWVSTFDGLIEFARRDGEWKPLHRYLPDERIRALHADRLGHLWFATNTYVARFDQTSRTPVIVVPASHSLDVDSLTTDRSGRLWLVDTRRGLIRVERNGTVAGVPLPSPVAGTLIRLTFNDSHDAIWLAFASGELARIDPGGMIHLFGAADGVSGGEYRSVIEDSSGVLWFGGQNGLTRFADGAFATVSGTTRIPADFVKSVLQDAQGNLWLGTNAGIARVARTEFDRTTAGNAPPAGYLLLDKFDGLAGPPRLLGDRSAAVSDDGRLWFVTGRGLTIVTPGDHAGRSPQPEARVAGITVDGRPDDPGTRTSVGANSSKLEIEYSALNLTTPHKTRFRYRLDGFDTDWVDAGVRRTAFYTNLPPGPYRFRVAATADGLTWNESAGVWAFRIEPHFYQTRSFAVFALAVFMLGAWGLWRIRVARMRQQFAVVLAERLRLSREIHDTLLQGIVGVAVQCDALANVADNPKVHDGLKRLRRHVEDYIREFRQSIWNLRSPVLEQNDFTTALRMTAERVTAATDIQFEMSVTGSPAPTRPNIEQQLLRIVHEATSNAVRHSGADRLQLQVHYAPGAISLRIVDDGRGFVPAAGGVQEASGHWGLPAMRERARTVGGELFIHSEPGHGTDVEVVVPAGPRASSGASR